MANDPVFSYSSGDGKNWRSWRGEFTALFYVVIWLASLGAPFLLLWLWTSGRRTAFTVALEQVQGHALRGFGADTWQTA